MTRSVVFSVDSDDQHDANSDTEFLITDCKLLEAMENGNQSALLKEELRTKIQLKRLKEGKSELEVTFEEPKNYELTEDEKERIKKRKDRNKEAAKKSRSKKKELQTSLQKEHEQLTNQKRKLLEDVEKLRKIERTLEKSAHNSRLCSARNSPVFPRESFENAQFSSDENVFPSHLQNGTQSFMSEQFSRKQKIELPNNPMAQSLQPSGMEHLNSFNSILNSLVEIGNKSDARHLQPQTSVAGQHNEDYLPVELSDEEFPEGKSRSSAILVEDNVEDFYASTPKIPVCKRYVRFSPYTKGRMKSSFFYPTSDKTSMDSSSTGSSPCVSPDPEEYTDLLDQDYVEVDLNKRQ